ncbi:MAG: hypothetical protein V3U92_19600 [Cellulophaga sp.]
MEFRTLDEAEQFFWKLWKSERKSLCYDGDLNKWVIESDPEQAKDSAPTWMELD